MAKPDPAAGNFKKSILADGIADHITPIFNDASTGKPISFAYAWAAAIGFTLQMYFDFSGYSEMALGLARMVGIKLPMNFNSPLKALSIVDYWSRWHITLTRFLTAYIYNPIAVAQARRRSASGKKGLAGTRTTWGAFAGIVAMPTMVTMFLSGLWHGAGNQFLIFGVLHGTALVINHAWRLVRPRVWPDSEHYRRTTWPIAWLLTFLIVMVALTWFHAASVTAGTNIIVGLTGAHGIVLPEEGVEFATMYVWIVLLMVIALVPPNTLEILHAWQPAITMPAAAVGLYAWHGWQGRIKLSLTPICGVATGVFLAIGVLGLNRVSEFLYWHF